MSKLAKNPLKIQSMFSSIAPRYDLLNRLLSLGRDRYWRRFAIKQLPGIKDGVFLDVATGTGDIAIEIIKRHNQNTKVIGIDFSEQMLELGRKKIIKLGYQNQIDLRFGDITSLPFKDKTFDAAIIAFGIRNTPDYKTGLGEMTRVLRDRGRIVILEFTSVQSRFFRLLFRTYLTKILPFIGGIISGRKGAYKYLSDSVLDFPDPEEFKKIMEEMGLKEVKYYPLTFSIVTVHVGIK
ncbi:MAG: bifunctional demethylmenaquinone methyltransferase/2-methoxy-6-polyprenyl-1,4-benzoquinol methylase UbiE [Thermodesulfovibrionia bacterium]|nr:bifunctional demethylmenaquinone methyltransferase/2-methoxy-6-polyprenyl-1,4-benzoquinol methylase UbiE [Thermodesulfovibrionia bacterium]